MTLYPQRLIESEAPPRTQYTSRYDYDGSGNLIYQGFAISRRNPLTSDAVWAIKKFTITGSNTTLSQWSLGGESSIWDNRATSVVYQ